jgi:hypothetical protein
MHWQRCRPEQAAGGDIHLSPYLGETLKPIGTTAGGLGHSAIHCLASSLGTEGHATAHFLLIGFLVAHLYFSFPIWMPFFFFFEFKCTLFLDNLLDAF